MGYRQILAQVAVFALVGLNVTAYYVFWPRWEADAIAAGQVRDFVEVVGEQPLPKPPAPVDFPAASDPPFAPKAAPVQEAPKLAAPKLEAPKLAPPTLLPNIAEKEALDRLIKQIERDNAALMVPQDAPPPAPMLPIEPPTELGSGCWQFKTEVLGAQTQVVAQVRSRPGIVFHIQCDRAETVDGTLQAQGKVTFRGAGLSGSCQRLSMPLNAARIDFDGDVRLSHETSSQLRGERLTWEMTQPRPVVFSEPK